MVQGQFNDLSKIPSSHVWFCLIFSLVITVGVVFNLLSLARMFLSLSLDEGQLHNFWWILGVHIWLNNLYLLLISDKYYWYDIWFITLPLTWPEYSTLCKPFSNLQELDKDSLLSTMQELDANGDQLIIFQEYMTFPWWLRYTMNTLIIQAWAFKESLENGY